MSKTQQQTKIQIIMATTTTTKEQFLKDARKRGFKTRKAFANVFTFMDFCYKKHLTDENSICWINPDGSSCIIAY